MKKIYGFLTAAAILLTAACTQDLEDPKKVDEVKGDFFMTMNITPAGNASTRATTQTGNQGKEVGQDVENTIGDALVIFAKPKSPTESDQYVVFAVLGGEGATPTMSGGNRIDGKTSYSATFKTDRTVLLNDVAASSEMVGSEKAVKYQMFVIANPTPAMKTAYNAAAAKYSTEPVDVQTTFAVASENDNTYWTNDKFLMTNSTVASDLIVIKASDVELGTHTSPAEALSLGSVTVQRAMSRFDIATGRAFEHFEIENEKSPIKKLSIDMEGVALVNMAKTANMFKVTADDYATLGSKTLSFAAETYNDADKTGNWVFSPVQKNVDSKYDFFYPMFTNITEAESSPQGKIGDLTGTVYTDLATNFTYTSWTSLQASGSRDTFEKPSDAAGDWVPSGYKFWRYCMENTNPDQIENQMNAVSTGVIFKAKFTVEPNVDDEGAYTFVPGSNLYAFGNVFFGSLTHLRDYVYMVNSEEDKGHTDDADVYATVSNKFTDAVEAYNKKQNSDETKFYVPASDEDTQTGIDITSAGEETLSRLDSYLVNKTNKGQGFAIYRPTDIGQDDSHEYVYYCYYIYWNRHNNNYDNTQMGIMEFATVRNNIYKLSVGAVRRLGHPANPDDDPKTPDPDDPDEEDEFYCTIDCKVLDWEVRVNNIEF